MKLSFPGSLHNHSDSSNFRLRDAIITVPELIDYAIELGQEVVAFTEHETVANAIKIEKYYNKVKESHPDFKVIRGNEIYLVRNDLTAENFEKGIDNYWHFILLAKDAIGHQQIRELSTRAWLRSWKTNKMVRVPTYYSDIIEIIGANPGHVIGSTACLGGFLASKILEYSNNNSQELYENIIGWIKRMNMIFGANNFFLEMQPSKSKEQIVVNTFLKEVSNLLGIPFIITTDSHYLKKEDAPFHKAFLTAAEGEREVDEFYATTYLMDTEELESYMNSYLTEEDFNKAYNTIKFIKNSCEDYSLLKPLKIPSLHWRDCEPISKSDYKYFKEAIPYIETFYKSNFDGDKKLIDLIINKIKSDKRLQDEKIYKEINNNLESTWISSNVNNAHWSAYFLNLQKIIDICWEAGTLVGPGRGSGVGFLLLYMLDIIQINSQWETTKTFSWRFLNPERVSVLD